MLPCVDESVHWKFQPVRELVMPAPKRRPSWLAHVTPPAVVLLAVAPVALRPAMYSWEPDGDYGWLIVRLIFFLPFWIGMAAAPGYLRTIYVLRRGLPLDRKQAAWLGVSLVLAAAACVGGVITTWRTLIPIPIYPLGSALSLVVVLRVAYFLRLQERARLSTVRL